MERHIRFTIEFEEPTREQKLSVDCPFCKAAAGASCKTRGPYNRHKPKPIRTFHHDRTARALGLTVVHSSSVYRMP